MVRVSGSWLAVWLLGSLALVWRRGHWTAYAHGEAAIVAFVLLGPLQEELLFRRAIFEFAQRVFRNPAPSHRRVSGVL